jgi:hypothetical protein
VDEGDAVRGHEYLIHLRRQTGRKPKYVIVCCGTDQERGWKWWPYLGQPEVEIEPTDVIGHLDLRWAHGLNLAIIGSSEDRVLEFWEAAEKVKPAKMYALMNFDDSVMESEDGTK